MASINDVYNQLVTVNATLSSVNSDVTAGTVATNGVKTSVDQLDTDLKAGFSQTVSVLNQVANTLAAVAAIELENAKLIYHLTQQADTMICSLEHISENTCAILTQSAMQTALQTSIDANVDGLLSIAEFAYPAGALERERLAKLKAQVERCCPPETVPPACSFTPCPKPRPIGEPKLPELPKAPRASGQPG